ncbi:MAG: hypothetical protein KDD62_04765 [Bdellovibrionales bacterium]|nr:hypothetical protein [Bdellovibrionales bacterium]
MKDSNMKCQCCSNSGLVSCNHCFGQKNIWVGVSATCGTGWQKCEACGGTGRLACPEHCGSSKSRMLMSSQIEIIRDQDRLEAPHRETHSAAVLFDD